MPYCCCRWWSVCELDDLPLAEERSNVGFALHIEVGQRVASPAGQQCRRGQEEVASKLTWLLFWEEMKRPEVVCEGVKTWRVTWTTIAWEVHVTGILIAIKQRRKDRNSKCTVSRWCCSAFIITACYSCLCQKFDLSNNFSKSRTKWTFFNFNTLFIKVKL